MFTLKLPVIGVDLSTISAMSWLASGIIGAIIVLSGLCVWMWRVGNRRMAEREARFVTSMHKSAPQDQTLPVEKAFTAAGALTTTISSANPCPDQTLTPDEQLARGLTPHDVRRILESPHPTTEELSAIVLFLQRQEALAAVPPYNPRPSNTLPSTPANRPLQQQPPSLARPYIQPGLRHGTLRSVAALGRPPATGTTLQPALVAV